MINIEPKKDKLTNSPCFPTKLIPSSYEQRNNPIHQTTTWKNMWLSILDSEQLNSHFEFVLFPFWHPVKFAPGHPQPLIELFV